MPPAAKPIITNISQMICKNCLYADEHWQEETVKCRKDLDDELSDFAKISKDNFFCSHGAWRIIIAQSRPSTACFLVAYDYLENN